MSNEIFLEGQRVKVNSVHLKTDPLSTIWTKQDGNLLLNDKIKLYCENPNIKMICPFDESNLEPACYKLRLGDEYRVDGKDDKLSDKKRMLKIPPHGLAIVRTYEWINMPGFLIGRWSLKVKKVYKGLLWVGGPQVDPGYQGYLFCPLYNLSNQEVKLEYKEALFTIDFVRTTIFDEKKQDNRLWEAKPERSVVSIGSLDVDNIQSGVSHQLKKMEKTVESIRSETRAFQIAMVTAMSITFAALAIIVGLQIFKGAINWATFNIESLPVILSIVAIIVAGFGFIIGLISLFKRF